MSAYVLLKVEKQIEKLIDLDSDVHVSEPDYSTQTVSENLINETTYNQCESPVSRDNHYHMHTENETLSQSSHVSSLNSDSIQRPSNEMNFNEHLKLNYTGDHENLYPRGEHQRTNNASLTENVTGQPLFYQTPSTVSRKKRFFTAEQPDKSSELTKDHTLLDYKQLNVTTFNCKNIRACGPIFEKFAKTEDIVLIQEHWLFKCQLDLLNELNENFMSAGKSVDYTDHLIPPIQIPRGYGGVAIFWKKDIDHIVNSLEIGNQRIICIELLTERPTLVICVYMPCNGETDSYHSHVECIEQLQEIIYTYQGTHEIIIGGDFNENAVVNNNSKRSSCFHTFIRENDLMTRNTEHTFIHPNGKDSSTIDFFLYKQRTDKSITKIERVESYSESVSDHYPVSMTMNVNFKKRSLKATSSIKTVTRIKWNSVDKQQ